MNLKALPFFVLALSSIPAFAQTSVNIVPAHPTDCRQADELTVMTLKYAAAQEDEDNLWISAQFYYQSCANGGFIYKVAPEYEDRMVVLMKDGWRYPWNYKAPAKIDVVKGRMAERPFTSVMIELKKSELFAEKDTREFELVVTPARHTAGFNWHVDIQKERNPGEGTKLIFSPMQ